MSSEYVTYELLKELPMYHVGTLVTHEFEILPSQYNSGTYCTDGTWITDDKVRATQFLQALIEWCASSQRTDDNHEDWVQIVAQSKPKQPRGGE